MERNMLSGNSDWSAPRFFYSPCYHHGFHPLRRPFEFVYSGYSQPRSAIHCISTKNPGNFFPGYIKFEFRSISLHHQIFVPPSAFVGSLRLYTTWSIADQSAVMPPKPSDSLPNICNVVTCIFNPFVWYTNYASIIKLFSIAVNNYFYLGINCLTMHQLYLYLYLLSTTILK